MQLIKKELWHRCFNRTIPVVASADFKFVIRSPEVLWRKKCLYLHELSSFTIWLISQYQVHLNNRSSHKNVFCKKVVLKNFAQFAEKNLCRCLFFHKVVSLGPATLLQKRFRRRCIPVNFAKKFKNTYFAEHLETAASELWPHTFEK